MTIKDLIRLWDNDLNKLIILEDPNGGWCNVNINGQDKIQFISAKKDNPYSMTNKLEVIFCILKIVFNN